MLSCILACFCFGRWTSFYNLQSFYQWLCHSNSCLFLCLHSGPKIINVKHLLHSDIYLRQVFIASSFSIVWLFCQKDIFFREKIDSLFEQKIVNEKNKAFWHLKHSVRFFSSAWSKCHMYVSEWPKCHFVVHFKKCTYFLSFDKRDNPFWKRMNKKYLTNKFQKKLNVTSWKTVAMKKVLNDRINKSTTIQCRVMLRNDSTFYWNWAGMGELKYTVSTQVNVCTCVFHVPICTDM